jgi:hypothetical protein
VSPSKIGGGSELEVNGGVRICFTLINYQKKIIREDETIVSVNENERRKVSYVVAAIVLFVEVKNERK